MRVNSNSNQNISFKALIINEKSVKKQEKKLQNN